MAATNDKARFFLEQTVPELQEYERKKIFTKDEISAITKQRSAFEHVVNSRDATPAVYARYASYEMNLDALRRKRVQRLGAKQPMHSGQRRVYGVLERATGKFHGDVALWMQHVEYARANKAGKKVEELLARCLRLHPARPELWTYAARYALDVGGDVKAARGYMQRGLRFCERRGELWVDYARVEMVYVAKIAGRRRILGLDKDLAVEEDVKELSADGDDGMISLPTVTAEHMDPALSKGSTETEERLRNLASTPVLSGAIPIAIFDAAMKQFGNDLPLARQFYDAIADFEQVPCLQKILQHVLDSMHAAGPRSTQYAICHAKFPCAGLSARAAEFPTALAESLQRIRAAVGEDASGTLAAEAVQWLTPMELLDGIDDDVNKAIRASIKRLVKASNGPALVRVAGVLRDKKQLKAADRILALSEKQSGHQKAAPRGHDGLSLSN